MNTVTPAVTTQVDWSQIALCYIYNEAKGVSTSLYYTIFSKVIHNQVIPIQLFQYITITWNNVTFLCILNLPWTNLKSVER